ncbi:dd-gdca protein [Anaeramoeba flamelloides]|uniref:Dd-gdca protein n=1 Tax=Anaeramoeba flamelloides TaxID=1746091 RepID=A0AAV7Z6D2_9EUKA|nr:dd-gdca protein [Anaeramoeba flamelloides]
MKIIVFLFFIVLLLKIECAYTKYADLGDKCNPTENLMCYPYLWCNSDNKCVKDNINEKCNDNSDCSGGLCSEGVCSAKRSNGDQCYGNDDCKSEKCSDSKCVGSFALNEQCDKSVPRKCNNGLFCNSSSICQSYNLENQECTSTQPTDADFFISCEPGFYCDIGGSNTCVRPFSVPESSACGSSFVCKKFLACQNNTCTSKYETCDDALMQCPTSGWCKQKTENSGECVWTSNPDVQDVDDNFVECTRKNKCPIDIEPVPGTCAYDKCFDLWQLLECGDQKDYPNTFYHHNPFSCTTPSPTPTNTDEGKSHKVMIAVVSSILGVIAIILICFVIFIKKRNKKLLEKETEYNRTVIGSGSSTKQPFADQNNGSDERSTLL